MRRIDPSKVSPIRSLLVVAMCSTWISAGVRNLPRLSRPHTAAVCCVVAVCIWLAYRAGGRRVKATAVAAAVAQAEATAVASVQARTSSSSNANVIVVNNPALGARARGTALGLDDVPWIAGQHRSVELDETEVIDAMIEDAMSADYEVDR